VLVVAEDDELPDQLRQGAVVEALPLVDAPHIGEDSIEIAADAVAAIGLGAGPIDRAAHHHYLVSDRAFEDSLPDIVEIDAVAESERDVAHVRRLEDEQQLGIEERFAVIRQLDRADLRVLVEQLGEIGGL